MSETPDLGALSELFQDLSVQLRRLNIRQDGEPRAVVESDWEDIPEAVLEPDRGPGRERTAVCGSAPAAGEPLQQEGPSNRGGPVGVGGDSTPGTYKAAVQRAATVLVTPISTRRGVMAAPGGDGAAAGTIQQAVANCANAAAFDTLYQGNAQLNARRLMEQFGMTHPAVDVRLAATQKKMDRQDREIHNLNAGLTAANTAAQNAAAAAAAAQAVATAAGNADRFRPASPPKYGNKSKDPDIRQWLAVVEDYLRTAPDNDYLRLASSYLEGGPRMLWQTRYEAYRAGHGNVDPPIPRQFFRQTLEANYGLADLEQQHWDAWNSLKMTSGMEYTEYVVQFQQALSDLANHIQDEQVKIEKFREGLINDLKEITRTSPTGVRWQTLQALITYAGLQWPMVKERINRRKSHPPAQKVAGKRKGAGGAGGSPKSKARVGAAVDSKEPKSPTSKEPKLCFVCKSPDHIASSCPRRKSKRNKKEGKVAAAQAEAMEEDFA